MGLALGLLAQVGDLAQSLLKRAAGVKEAGHLLPGHGGVLDRLDSVVFVLPLVYYGVRWLERGG
jgi:phosphatidate cytidylyltransferase